MRILYAWEQDADDVNRQSGRPYFLLRALEAQGCTVLPAFPLSRAAERRFFWKRCYHRLFGRTYYPDREPAVLQSLAKQVERKLRNVDVDCVVAPGSHAIAAVRTETPKILVADATFANVLDFYAAYSNLAGEYVAAGHAQEQIALAGCRLAVYPSDWAAESAIRDYGASRARVHVLPFGANVPLPRASEVLAWIDEREVDRLRVLFVGRDWNRKGGPICVEACKALVSSGIDVRLDVVGATPPAPFPSFMVAHGRLDKSRPEDARRLAELFARAHFFCLPSQAENFGLAFCEAAAFGVPSLATAVGGVSAVVQPGRTGFIFAPGTPSTAYAAAMIGLFQDRQAYRVLARAAYTEAAERLNWTEFSRRLVGLIREAL